MKKKLSIILIVFLMISLLAACRKSSNKLNGYYVAEDSMVALTSFSSFDFSGSKVTIGLAGGTQSYEVAYDYEPGKDDKAGTLSFTMAGSSVNVPVKIQDGGEKLLIGENTYKKK